MSQTQRSVVLLGAGGELPNIIDLIQRLNRQAEAQISVNAILDDDSSLHGCLLEGLPVKGPLSNVSRFTNDYLLWGLGSVQHLSARLEIVHSLGLQEDRFLTLIDPRSCVSPTAKIAPGVTILAGSCVGAGAKIHPHVFLGFNCVIEHGSAVGPGSLAAAGATLASNVEVGAATYLGQACCVREGIMIGDRSIVGMGSVVIRNVGSHEVVAGNPARHLRNSSDHQGRSDWLTAAWESSRRTFEDE